MLGANVTVLVSADEIPSPDEATLALQKQLADLKKSEELQRQYARQLAQQQQPPTHQQLLEAWRSQGADEGDLAFLESNPSLMDNPRLCRLASDEAAEHHQRGTDGHRQATLELFKPAPRTSASAASGLRTAGGNRSCRVLCPGALTFTGSTG
jgi:hypothetical protein